MCCGTCGGRGGERACTFKGRLGRGKQGGPLLAPSNYTYEGFRRFRSEKAGRATHGIELIISGFWWGEVEPYSDSLLTIRS